VTRTRRQANARRAAALFRERTTPKILGHMAIKEEVLDRSIDAVDEHEIEAIAAEIGAKGARHPGSE